MWFKGNGKGDDATGEKMILNHSEQLQTGERQKETGTNSIEREFSTTFLFVKLYYKLIELKVVCRELKEH